MIMKNKIFKNSLIFLLTLIIILIGFLSAKFICDKTSSDYSETDVTFIDSALKFIDYSSLEVISGIFLKSNDILNYENDVYDCYIFTDAGEVYEDCDLSNTFLELPTVVTFLYNDDELIEYSNSYSKNIDLEVMVYNVGDYSLNGIFSENENLITENSRIDLNNVVSGEYIISYDQYIASFYINIDETIPELSNVTSENDIIYMDYTDENIYDVYYFISEYIIEPDYDLNFMTYIDYLYLCEIGDYHIYTYAEDESGNKSMINYGGVSTFSCQDNNVVVDEFALD